MSRKSFYLHLVYWIHSVLSCKFIMHVFVCEIHIFQVIIPKLLTSFVESCIWDGEKKGNKFLSWCRWQKKIYLWTFRSTSARKEIYYFDQYFVTSGFVNWWHKLQHSQRWADSWDGQWSIQNGPVKYCDAPRSAFHAREKVVSEEFWPSLICTYKNLQRLKKPVYLR